MLQSVLYFEKKSNNVFFFREFLVAFKKNLPLCHSCIRRSHLRASLSLVLFPLPEKLDYDDGRVEEVDGVLEEDEAVQVRLVGPAVRQEVPDDPQPDVGAQGEEESWAWKTFDPMMRSQHPRQPFVALLHKLKESSKP